MIRNNMLKLREAIETHYMKGKPMVVTHDGRTAFSLLIPPLGDPVATRRVRKVTKNVLDSRNTVQADGLVNWARRTPHIITLAPTYDCQCDCGHCSAFLKRQAVRREKSQMTFAEIRNVIGQTIELGTTSIVLVGGEPLLYPEIFGLVGSIDRDKCLCTLFSNGEFMTSETVAKLREAGAYGVFFSLDSSDPDEHNRNRKRPGLFLKAMDGIRRCQDAGIVTGMSTFVTKDKIASGEMEAMMELARRMSVLEVFFFDIIPTGKMTQRRECVLSLGESDEIKKFRERYNENPDFPRIIHQTMFSSLTYPCAAEGCPAATVYMHIQADGSVCPCDFTPLVFGNVREKSLKEIWEAMSGNEIYSKTSARCRYQNQEFCDLVARFEQSQLL
jgi:MoaA/NifB/PqqE/SkfB family radical SAM enzyme